MMMLMMLMMIRLYEDDSDKVKMKLSLCLTKYHAVKMYSLHDYTPRHDDVLVAWRYSSHTFLTSVLDGGDQLHVPVASPQGKEPPVPIG
jgi:hypothetical protein